MQEFGHRCVLADDMGLGKTLQLCYALRELGHTGGLPALVVCPASLKYMWQREALQQCGLVADVIEGRTPEEALLFDSEAHITIINYDILDAWLDKLLEVGFKTVVFDECQEIRNPDTKRSVAAHTIARSCEHVLGASGTPIENGPGEFWHILNLVRPDLFGSRLDFGMRYARPKMERGKWSYRGARNTDELHSYLTEHCMVRRRKVDVLDLPEKTRSIIPLKLANNHAKEYKHADEDFLGWLRRKSPGRARRATRNQALTRLGYLRRLAAKLKLKQAVGWAHEWLRLNPTEQLVCFGYHTPLMRVLAKHLPDTVVVTGTTPLRQRQAAVDAFQQGQARCFAGQITAAGTGLTLTAASNVAFFELDWVPARLSQAEDRVHRIGQDNFSHAYYLIALGTVEEWLCNLLQDKQQGISGCLDGGTNNMDIDLRDLLLKHYYHAA